MRSLAWSLLICSACSSSAPAPARPVTPDPPDAAVAIVDAPVRPDIKLEAPAYVFRYSSTARSETWTLWFTGGVAVLDVQPAQGAVTQYQGTATEGATVVIEVESATAKMKLDCKRTKREVEAACDPSAKPATKPKKTTVDALDCFHADFKEPMPFGPAPGIVYFADGACAGYRSVPSTP